jgi:DNA-binding CsgD family transcriptional regulator
MTYYTEKELGIGNQIFAFKLRQLFRKDNQLFNQLRDYLPNPMYINGRDSQQYSFFNESFFKRGKEIETLFELGKVYLPKISNLVLLDNALMKAARFVRQNDYNAVCTYLQQVSLHGKMSYFFTNKVLLDDHSTLNVSYFMDEMTLLRKVFSEIVPCMDQKITIWQRFQTLTKQEKKILKLLAEGYSNKEISDLLFISFHTVHTHRRNIYQKLNIHKTSELIRLSIALELI